MKRVKDSNSEYVQCENSNLRFHGTKLDRNGNECAVFSTPNHNTFSIQRNSLWGTQSWNTGSKSTMDAETFLEKNPKVSLESLERDVIKLANQTKAAWGKNIRVHNKQILDSKRRVRDGYDIDVIESPDYQKNSRIIYDKPNSKSVYRFVENYIGKNIEDLRENLNDVFINSKFGFTRENGNLLIMSPEIKIELSCNNGIIEDIVSVTDRQVSDSRRVKDDDSSQKGLIEDFSSWASAERCPLTPYHFKGFRENDPSFNSNAAFDIIDELVKWNGFILEDLSDLVVAKFDTHDNAAVEECCEDIKFRVGNALSRVDRYFNDNNYIVQLYIKALERAHRLAVNELKSLNTVSDSRKIKDAKMRKAYLGTIPIGRYFNLQDRDWVVMKHNVLDGTVVCKSVVGDDEMEFQSITEVYMYDISDSRKIKDENTPDVLDGVLFVAFEDGTEDEMIAEVNKHKNESGKIDGVQYETYETDSQDGVAMIDLCAATADANAFVKALLKEWGIAKNVADLEFEASDEMKEAVSDSRKIKDEWEDNESFYEYFGIQPATDEKTLLQGMDEILKGYSDREMAALQAEHYLNISADIARGWLAKKGISTLDEFKKWCAQRQSYLRKGKRQRDKEVDESFEKMRQEVNLEKMLKQAYQAYDEYEKAHSVSDSRVNDMTKPIRWKAYAERVRAKRRNKNEETENEPENEKQDVADSRRIKDEYGTVAYFTTIGKNKYGEDRYHVEIVNKFDKGDFVVDEFDVDNYTDGFITVKGLVWKIYINGRPIWEN
jgi:hypothetical protein